MLIARPNVVSADFDYGWPAYIPYHLAIIIQTRSCDTVVLAVVEA